MGKTICGIMISQMSSTTKAIASSEKMRNCPYVIASGTSSEMVYNVFHIPSEKKWWLNYPTLHPEVLGAEKVKVEIIEDVLLPQKFAPRIPTEKATISPCGTACQTCPMFKEIRCKGCPSTIHYKDVLLSEKNPNNPIE